MHSSKDTEHYRK